MLKGGNRALLANIALGLPVRVFRRNDDRGGATNSVLFYDGLYDVVSAAGVIILSIQSSSCLSCNKAAMLVDTCCAQPRCCAGPCTAAFALAAAGQVSWIKGPVHTCGPANAS
jgi:hypothetical protein